MKKLSTLALMVIALVLLTSAGIYAQRTVSGVVTDDTGEPMIGANVLEQGTSNGTITDLDGSYSLSVADGATIVFSFTGFTDQLIAVGNQSVINIELAAGELLDEVVVVGYGSQSEKEITSSVVSVSAEEFNKGPISDPAQLLQGKVAGLQVYNRGGDPNGSSVIRLRGLSTVGANAEPLVVIDGVIGASLDNVDPNDIENVNVLKDGSAAAIYGSRGSSGVIIVTTKKGKAGDNVKLSYSGQVGTSSAVNGIEIMGRDAFLAAGGTDIGADTDWVDAVTRSGFTHNHSLSATGGGEKANYRVSANVRNVDGILQNSGFEQFNTRANFSTRTLNDKLKIDFNASFTNRDQENGFYEALRYAIIYNPTAPINGVDSPYPFNAEQFGGYFETLGLFDSFNPVSIINQNTNDTKRREFNYGANLNYSISDNLTANFRIAEQSTTNNSEQYNSPTSLFRGGAESPLRKGQATFNNNRIDFKLYEAFGTYTQDFSNVDFTFTGGYSFQQNNFSQHQFSVGDFPNAGGINYIDAIEASQDVAINEAGFIDAFSDRSPDEKIIAFFGRANFTIDNGIFINASLRREGSSKLGDGNKWGNFPAFGVGVDLAKYLNMGNVDNFKIRLGYGVTGALPVLSGLSQEIRQINNDAASGAVTTTLLRAANPDLKWEEKKETNLGLEFGLDRFSATLDLYNRDIQDFILERTVDITQFGVDRRFENAGLLNTKGIELALNYDVIRNSNVNYSTGVVISSYKSTLEEYIIPEEARANLGAPGQNATTLIRVAEGEAIGQIWGPVFEGVSEGSPIFADVNGDGVINAGLDAALADDGDFQQLGSGIPDLELGWSNQLQIGDWSVNAFFRGAFGHSLVNTFRAFYEPQLASQSSYNFVNTSLAEPGLTSARFSSLYVEKADFFKLDNLTIARSFDLGADSPFSGLNVSLTGQNLFVITSYTGTDPEPSLVDSGEAGNGGTGLSTPDPLSPGIDRRNNYFSTRAFTFGVNLTF